MPRNTQFTSRALLPAPAHGSVATGAPHVEEREASLTPLGLRQLLAALRGHIWLVLAITAVGAGGAAYFALTTPPVYRAQGVIRLADTKRQLTAGLTDVSSDKGVSGSTTDPILSSLAVLTSRAVVGKVIDSMPSLRLNVSGLERGLIHDFRIDAPGADTVSFPDVALTFDPHGYTATVPGGPPLRAAYGGAVDVSGLHFVVSGPPKKTVKQGTLAVRRYEDAAQRLASKIKAEPRQNTNVIDVTFTSPDPVLAQRVINTLLTVFQAASIDDAAQQARLRRQFLESQLRENDSVLNLARGALSSFRSRQRTYSTREKFSAERADLSALAVQREQLQNQRQLYASVLHELQIGHGREAVQQVSAALSAEGGSPSPIVLDQFSRMQHLLASRDSLTTGPGARAATNPDVQALDAMIARTSDGMQKTMQGILSTLDGRIASLTRQQGENTSALVQIPATDAEEAQLTEREEAYRKSADELRDELQKARLAEAAEVGNVEIVDPATVPRAPVGTSSSREILFGLLFGMFFGVGSALVAEHLNTAIRGRDDLETVLQLPGLAVIPKLHIKSKSGVRPALPRTTENGRAGNGTVANGAGVAKAAESRALVQGRANALVTVHDARSIGAEAYRTLRTKLLFTRAITDLKTIIVTSPFAQDGKSTVASNLAASFAQHGMRVLLIDCDLRRASQHEIFQVPCEPGLTELLIGDGLVAGTGRRTSIEGLSLITAGTLPPDPAELVGSARMRDLLARLGESFDVVVLDTPPVLPVADSTILASMADGVLLVVRAGQTDRRAAQLAVQQLQDVDARILGVVLNDPKSQAARYDQYGYASYYAAYTSDG